MLAARGSSITLDFERRETVDCSSDLLPEQRSRVIDILRARGAHVLPYARWSLLKHLIGIQHVLTCWKQPVHLQLAGLVHGVYSTDKNNNRVSTQEERRIVQDVVGDSAERLAYLFNIVPRASLVAIAAKYDSVAEAEYRISQSTKNRVFLLSGHDVRDLILLHVANIVEQCEAPNGGPTNWLFYASKVARFADNFPFTAPIFNHCKAIVDREAEIRLNGAYALALRARSVEAVRDLEIAAEEVPWVGEPYVWLGLNAFAEDDIASAVRFGTNATHAVETWGSAWDKRMSADQWLTIARFLQQSAQLSTSERRFLTKAMRDVLDSTRDKPAGIAGRLESVGFFDADRTDSVGSVGASRIGHSPILPGRFAEYVGGFRSNIRSPRMGIYPRLRSRAFWNSHDFPLAMELESLGAAIADEYRRIPREAFHEESESVRRVGGWDVFLLFERGKKRLERCELVPVTTALVERHASILTMNGLVYFSRLGAQTAIAKHRGPTNLRLRCHLGIDVPEDCGIKVGDETRAWEEGKCLIFDDSLPHEAWNRSSQERVVLIVDLWHPDLSVDEVGLLQGLDRHVQHHANNLRKYWARNEGASQGTVD